MAEAVDRSVMPDTRLLGLLLSSRRRVMSGPSGLSATEFARSVNCAERTVRRYLTGGRAIPVEVLAAWERATDLVAGTLTSGPEGAATVWLEDERPPLPDDARTANESFVGRQFQLETVLELRKRAASVKQLVVVGGDPGIGKTRLVAAISRAAYDDGWTVLWGRCDEHLQLPFQPVAEALRPFVPNFAALLPDPVSRGGLGGARWEGLAQQRMFEEVSDLLARIARHRPILLVLDDLHWAADSTVQLLRHLILTRRPMPLLIVATWNTAEVDPDGALAAGLVDLAARDDVSQVVLGGLNGLEIEQLLPADRDTEKNKALALLLLGETGGNPLLVSELLRDLAEAGPQAPAAADLDRRPLPASTRAVVAKRLARRRPATRELLRLASVIGTSFELSVLARLSSPPGNPAGLVTLLDEALSARLIQESRPGIYQFVHNLVRRAISEQLSSTRRTLIHRDTAEAVEVVHKDNLDRFRPVLAYHLWKAANSVPYQRAVDATLAAGRQAVDQYDFVGAANYSRLGLHQLDTAAVEDPSRRCDLLCLAVPAQRDVEPRHAMALQAAEAAVAAGDPVRLALATELYCEWIMVGHFDQTAIDLCERCLTALPTEDRVNRARVTAVMAMNVAWSGQFDPAAQAQVWSMCREALSDMGTDADPATRWRVHEAYSVALHGSPDLNLRMEVATAAPVTGRYLGGLWHRAIIRLIGGDRASFEEDRLVAATSKEPWHRAVSAEWDALLALLDGRWDAVEGHASRAIESWAADLNFQNVYSGQLFVLAWETGRLVGLVPFVEAAVEASPAIRAWQAALALTYLEVGDHEAARRLLPTITADLELTARDFGFTVTLALVIEIAARLGDANSVARAACLLQPFSGQLIVVGTGIHVHGAVDRFLAISAGFAGRTQEAEHMFQTAATLEEQVRSVPLATRTKYWHARFLTHSPTPTDRARAPSLLDQVIDAAQRNGQQGLARQARRND